MDAINAARRQMEEALHARFGLVAHLLPGDTPIASSAGGLKSYEPGAQFAETDMAALPRDGEYILTDKNLVFADEYGAVRFGLDDIDTFASSARLHHLRYVKLVMDSGSLHQIGAGKTFLDEVAARLQQPNATERLHHALADEPVRALTGHMFIGATPDQKMPGGAPRATYETLVTATRLIGWTEPDQILEIALPDIREWRQGGPRRLQANEHAVVSLQLQNGSVISIFPLRDAAETIRKTAKVRKKRDRT
ncbi:hypothetical protein ACFVY0_33880 [Streptomyces sp. NPDC058286]|uniref:hypothetical protein n=1 Tax=Streptomyces sp. NPDC058286 TaxID=3346422 RepID=UPI0036EB01D4